MMQEARRLLGLQLAVLAALSACDETAQPRPPQPDAATIPEGGRGGSGGASVSGSGGSGPPGCSAAAPALLPAMLTEAVLGERYSQELSFIGATAADVGWSLVGPLPSGLALVENDTQLTDPPLRATAMLSGTPTAAGTFRFSISVSLLVPAMCAAPPAQREFELVVNDDADAGAL
jgi:hypothetical protein